jgi:glycosyltransferase involved in cell wall biosynthesis
MKILHINTICEKGGAALLMVTIAKNLEENYGLNNGYIIGRSSFKNSDDMLSLDKTEKYLFGQKKLKRILTEEGFQYVYMPSECYYSIKMAEKFKPDIIHLHNTHGDYFQINLIKKLAKTAPIVWTFHDMFPVTGHCAHSFDCEKWQTGCGKCQYLDTYPQLVKDRTKCLWKYKRRIYNSVDFKIVVPSEWLKSIVEKSFLKNKDTRLIYNGINTNIFRKTEKREARQRLKLPLDKKIILFTTHGGKDNQFKGGNFFSRVVDRYKDRSEVYFICVGGKDDAEDDKTVNNYGYVSSRDELSLLYSASDMYLFPTLADNCPLSVLEAMSCECPVVTFNVGGVPELVEHMVSGYVAEYKNEDDLVNGVEMLLAEEVCNKMGLSARKRVKEYFSMEKMSKSYFDLYNEVLKK